MIFIDRTKVLEPPSLKDKNRKGKKEKAAVIAFYKKPANRKKTYKFKAYKEPDVKQALLELFKGKCAYCESLVLHIYPGDIEHFRPKSVIQYKKGQKGKTIVPGYYWLAAEWDNLLLACKNCNSRATHTLADGTKFVTGKGAYFPLSDHTKHVTSPNVKINKEEDYRLLINPCIDKPEDYFTYDIKDGVVIASNSNPFKKRKAETSIELYGLQRMRLVHEREKVILNCFIQIERIWEVLLILDKAQIQKDKTHYTIVLDREVSILKSYCRPDAPYSAAAKQIYNDYFKPFY